MSAKPRVVVVGAGMAGLAAAHRLHEACGHAFDLTILEGSNRVGGRIQTVCLGSDLVELGATFIHGINGNPIYHIAQRIGAFSDPPCDFVDSKRPLFRAQGAHLPVDPHLLSPAMDLYRSSMALVREREIVGQPLHGSVGAFLRQRLHAFLYEAATKHTFEDHCNIGATPFIKKKKEESSKGANDLNASGGKIMDIAFECDNPDVHMRGMGTLSKCEGGDGPDAHGAKIMHMSSKCKEGDDSDAHSGQKGINVCEEDKNGSSTQEDETNGKANSMWNTLLLQESAFLSLEARERCVSACDSLDDLDLASLKEYTEYPGPHVTIDKGYASVLNELESSLPSGIVKLGEKVEKIFWNHSHPSVFAPVVLQCENGCVVQAEHVILTMSLGVLKAGISKSLGTKHLPPICRSVQDLRGWKASKEVQNDELFEPSLPPWKLDAISRLGFGIVDKVFVLLDPAADKRLLDNIAFLHHKELKCTPRWMRKTFSMFPTCEGSNVVLCWLVGEEALEMESLSDDEVLDGVAQALSSFGLIDTDGDIELNTNNSPRQTAELKQRLRNMFKGLLRSKWATNPLCQGSYSFVAVGSSGADIDILAKPLPDTSDTMLTASKPSGNVCVGDDIVSEQPTDMGSGHSTKFSSLQLLFAGEATHRSFYSTTHGAFLSGIREAERILEHYKKGCQQMS